MERRNKEKPVVGDNWQTHGEVYFSALAPIVLIADMRDNTAKIMPYPTHANTLSVVSADRALNAPVTAMPAKKVRRN